MRELIALGLMVFSANALAEDAYSPIKPEVLWRAKVGKVHYRANVVVDGGSIYVPSNGVGWKSKKDPLDGLHVLNLKTGKSRRKLVPPGKGERDVNGLAFLERDLVITTDEGLVVRMTTTGKVRWKRRFDGDVESMPTLLQLNADETLDVVVGVEGGGVRALDGRTGRDLWSKKSGRGDDDQSGFISSAAGADVDGDGLDEVFIGGKDGVFRAINGQSGTVMWSVRAGSARNASAILVDTDGDGALEVIFTASYSEVSCHDAKTGAKIWSHTLEHPGGGIEGLFGAVSWLPAKKCALVGTAWWGEKEGVYCVGTEGVVWRYTVSGQKISSSFVLADVDGDAQDDVIFGTELGTVEAVNARGELVLRRYLDESIEATPVVADVDGDGRNDILVVDHSGKMVALKTRGKGAGMPYFRVDPRTNNAVIR